MEMRESGIEESQRIMTKTRLETGLLCKNPIKVTVYCTKSFPWLLYGNGSQARTRFKTAVNCLTDNCGKSNQTWSSWYGEGYVISLIISQGISISCNENPAIQYKVSDIKDVWFHQSFWPDVINIAFFLKKKEFRLCLCEVLMQRGCVTCQRPWRTALNPPSEPLTPTLIHHMGHISL